MADDVRKLKLSHRAKLSLIAMVSGSPLPEGKGRNNCIQGLVRRGLVSAMTGKLTADGESVARTLKEAFRV